MGYAVKRTYTCLWCGQPDTAVHAHKRFCSPGCGVKYREVNGSRLDAAAYPEPADVVARETKKQQAALNRLNLLRDMASMTYRIGGHTDAEYARMRAELAETIRPPRAWEWPAGRKVVE